MAEAQAVTEDTFQQEVLSSETPVLVDFWAEWCQPCHMVAPILDKIVEERNGTIKLVKINIDEQPALAQRYGIE
jgi:thioredoxin 1